MLVQPSRPLQLNRYGVRIRSCVWVLIDIILIVMGELKTRGRIVEPYLVSLTKKNEVGYPFTKGCLIFMR